MTAMGPDEFFACSPGNTSVQTAEARAQLAEAVRTTYFGGLANLRGRKRIGPGGSGEPLARETLCRDQDQWPSPVLKGQARMQDGMVIGGCAARGSLRVVNGDVQAPFGARARKGGTGKARPCNPDRAGRRVSDPRGL